MSAAIPTRGVSHSLGCRSSRKGALLTSFGADAVAAGFVLCEAVGAFQAAARRVLLDARLVASLAVWNRSALRTRRGQDPKLVSPNHQRPTAPLLDAAEPGLTLPVMQA